MGDTDYKTGPYKGFPKVVGKVRIRYRTAEAGDPVLTRFRHEDGRWLEIGFAIEDGMEDRILKKAEDFEREYEWFEANIDG